MYKDWYWDLYYYGYGENETYSDNSTFIGEFNTSLSKMNNLGINNL